MTDIVERLRLHKEADTWYTGGYRPCVRINPDGPEAADEITRLRSELEAVKREAVEALDDPGLAVTVANIRQGYSSTPRCEPPGQADIEIAAKWIKYVRAAVAARAFAEKHGRDG